MSLDADVADISGREAAATLLKQERDRLLERAKPLTYAIDRLEDDDGEPDEAVAAEITTDQQNELAYLVDCHRWDDLHLFGNENEEMLRVLQARLTVDEMNGLIERLQSVANLVDKVLPFEERYLYGRRPRD